MLSWFSISTAYALGSRNARPSAYPTAWAVFRRALISEGYGGDTADALLWEWEEHHCRGSRYFHLRPGGEECERAKKIRYFPVFTGRRGSRKE